ncbi:MAG: type I methionyl aminopeptidase [Actinomycetota bacterium]
MSTVLAPNELCWCGSGRKYKRCHRASELPVRAGAISPPRIVPDAIARPDYADGGEPRAGSNDPIQTPDVIGRLRAAGRIAGEVLDAAADILKEGITTDEIDAFVHEECVRRGVYPSTLNYRGYPKSLCTSINEIICHGIPDDRPLAQGDIVNVDITVFADGVHGDTSATFPVGVIADDSKLLLRVTRECLYLGIEAVEPGAPISAIGRAIEIHAAKHGFGVVRAFGGHGIGERFHTGLHIPHDFEPRASRKMVPGMVFTVEPMITLGTWRHLLWDDAWTAATTDGRRTAQYEHSVVVTDDGYEVLTPSQSLPFGP